MRPTLPPENLYRYFGDCYRLDYQDFAIENLLAKKYPHKWFIPEEELISQALPYVPFDYPKVDALEKEMALYRLEKKLWYAYGLVLGASDNPLAKDKRLCAPLLLFPAQLRTIDDLKFLEVNLEEVTVNHAVLSKFEPRTGHTKDAFIGRVTALFSTGKYEPFGLKRLLDEHFSNLLTDELLLFPRTWSQRAIKDFYRQQDLANGQYQLVPGAVAALVPKAASSLRVLNDLQGMAQQANYNSALRDILEEAGGERSSGNSYHAPLLNEAQQQALTNAHRFTNSVVVGPPGTGKTHTVAAMVAETVARGESVLVVSKTKPAVEVVRHLLARHFGLKDYLVHTTGQRYRLSLQAKVRRYLGGMYAAATAQPDHLTPAHFSEQLVQATAAYQKLVKQEMRWGDLTSGTGLSVLETLEKWWLSLKTSDIEQLWKHFERMSLTTARLERAVRKDSREKVKNLVSSHAAAYRQDLALFQDALEAPNFTAYKETIRQVEYRHLLKVFPVWLANLPDLNEVLPLRPDLFDLVIIDEATQCDMATALPALYRARRAVVVGDPNQLRHYSFVATARQEQLRQKHGLPPDRALDYRNRSVLDLYLSRVRSQGQVTFLREHFRSPPSLIEFSNQAFYEGQLRVMKSTPRHTTHRQIELVEVSGSRDRRGVNEREAEAVMARLDALAAEHEGKSSVPSVGIISPFSTQAAHLNGLVRQRHELTTIRRFDLRCGTPYTFQGAEREIVLLSVGLCDDSHPAAFRHAGQPEVLNVAVTRARSYQYVFSSVSDARLPPDSLLSRYFTFIRAFSHVSEGAREGDHLQQAVAAALRKQGFDDVRCGYPVAGYLLDILVVSRHHDCFIDLIGYPGNTREAFSPERYRALARVGIRSYPLPYSYWLNHRQSAIRRLVKFLKKR